MGWISGTESKTASLFIGMLHSMSENWFGEQIYQHLEKTLEEFEPLSPSYLSFFVSKNMPFGIRKMIVKWFQQVSHWSSRSSGKEGILKYEKNKSVEHSWESGETRTLHNNRSLLAYKVAVIEVSGVVPLLVRTKIKKGVNKWQKLKFLNRTQNLGRVKA